MDVVVVVALVALVAPIMRLSECRSYPRLGALALGETKSGGRMGFLGQVQGCLGKGRLYRYQPGIYLEMRRWGKRVVMRQTWRFINFGPHGREMR